MSVICSDDVNIQSQIDYSNAHSAVANSKCYKMPL